MAIKFFDMFAGIGGFECVGYCEIDKYAKQAYEAIYDTRGTLFFEIARIASVKKPKYLFLENVPGLLNHDSGKTFETILRRGPRKAISFLGRGGTA